MFTWMCARVRVCAHTSVEHQRERGALGGGSLPAAVALAKRSSKMICTSVVLLSGGVTRSRRRPALGTVPAVPSPGCFLQNAPGEAKKSKT